MSTRRQREPNNARGSTCCSLPRVHSVPVLVSLSCSAFYARHDCRRGRAMSAFIERPVSVLARTCKGMLHRPCHQLIAVEGCSNGGRPSTSRNLHFTSSSRYASQGQGQGQGQGQQRKPPTRLYKYAVDVYGQLFLHDTVPKNLTSCTCLCSVPLPHGR